MVLIPISWRGARAYFMARWKVGAKRNPIPSFLRHSFTFSFGRSTLTPRVSTTSALPQRLERALLPCLATVKPAPATTKAVAVEILKVLLLSPPVPQVSTRTSSFRSKESTLFSISLAQPVISSTVSPFILSAVKKEAIWAGVALPPIISPMTHPASSSFKLLPSTILLIVSLIIFPPAQISSRKFLKSSLPTWVRIDSG